MKGIRLTGAFVASLRSIAPMAVLLCHSANAHHGFGSFDTDGGLELDGTIVGLDFVNPHAWLYIEVASDGTAATFRCEMRGATVLRRSGWSEDLLPVGMRLKVEAGPDRNDPRSCYVNTLILPDGTRLDRYAQLATAPRMSDLPARVLRRSGGEPNISGNWAQEQYVMTDMSGRSGGLVPLSQVDEYEPGDSGGMLSLTNGTALIFELYQVIVGARDLQLGPWVDHGVLDLNEAGRAALPSIAEMAVNQVRICNTTGLIDSWLSESVVNRIAQYDDRITIEFGQTGQMRTIFMDTDAHPADLEPTPLGHSIGRWEDDVLVVETIGLSAGRLITNFVNSEQVIVTERYRLDSETFELTRDYIVEDPLYLNQPYVYRDVVLPSALPYAVDECVDTTTLNFSEQQ